MASIHNAYVKVTVPSLDPDDDPMSIGFAYRTIAVGGISSDTEFLVDNVPNFLNTAGAGASQAMSQWLAPSLDRGTNHCRVDVYDVGSALNGSAHGSPVDSGTFTLAAAGSVNGLPQGVAACISYRADYGTDVEFGAPTGVETGHLRPRARDRNRIYVGPLLLPAVSSLGPSGRCTFTSQFITDCLHNLHQILVINSTEIDDPTSSWGLSVWSRKGAFMKGITEFWMDDRPDYQRRRSDPGVKTFLAA